MNVETKLLPCPFCGASAAAEGVRLIEQGHTWNGLRRCDYRVQCLQCHVMTLTYDDKQEALDAWDRRATPLAHGEWEPLPEVIGYCRQWRCSICGARYIKAMDYKYCPKCGAKMGMRRT